MQKKQDERTMEQTMRKYPVGIQTFERIIKEGFIYVDKTDLDTPSKRLMPAAMPSPISPTVEKS